MSDVKRKRNMLTNLPPEVFEVMRGMVETDRELAEKIGTTPTAVAKYREDHDLSASSATGTIQRIPVGVPYHPTFLMTEEQISDRYAGRKYQNVGPWFRRTAGAV